MCLVVGYLIGIHGPVLWLGRWLYYAIRNSKKTYTQGLREPSNE